MQVKGNPFQKEARLSDRQALPHMLKEVTVGCGRLMISTGMWQPGSRLDLSGKLLLKYHMAVPCLLLTERVYKAKLTMTEGEEVVVLQYSVCGGFVQLGQEILGESSTPCQKVPEMTSKRKGCLTLKFLVNIKEGL